MPELPPAAARARRRPHNTRVRVSGRQQRTRRFVLSRSCARIRCSASRRCPVRQSRRPRSPDGPANETKQSEGKAFSVSHPGDHRATSHGSERAWHSSVQQTAPKRPAKRHRDRQNRVRANSAELDRPALCEPARSVTRDTYRHTSPPLMPAH